MMIGLVLVTHGNLANEFVAAMQHVVGPQENVATVCIGPEDDMESRRQEILNKVGEVDNGSGAIVLTDLFGGTPCNQTIRLLRTYPLQVVVGVNLPMILQAVLSNREDVTAQQLIAMAVENGRSGIFDAGARIQSLTEEE